MIIHNFNLSPLYHSTIKFNHLFNHLKNNQNQNNNNYPPYNIKLINENHYHITIAITNFTENKLKITTQNNLLIIKNTHTDKQKKHTYLYQNIAKHNFKHKFQLTENIHIHNTNLINNLLYIDLEHIIPKTKKPHHIEIN